MIYYFEFELEEKKAQIPSGILGDTFDFNDFAFLYYYSSLFRKDYKL